jgi:hypothetical protein
MTWWGHILFLACLASLVHLHDSWKPTRHSSHADKVLSIREVGAALGISAEVIAKGSLLASAAFVIQGRPAKAATSPEGDLYERFRSNNPTIYKPGIKISDVFYPTWFQGKWNVESVCTDVSAPLGIDAFGGQGAFSRAKKDVNTALKYDSIFKAFGDTVVGDRLYNVEQIAIASMGENSVYDDSQRSMDLASRIRLVLSPPAANVRPLLRIQH